MKKNKLYKVIGIPVLATVLLNAACGNGPVPEKITENSPGPGETDLPPGYRLRNFNVSAPLSAKPIKGNPRVTAALSLLEVKEPAREVKFINDLLYSGNSPEQYRRALVREYQAIYRQSPLPEMQDDLPPAVFQWEHLEIMDVRLLRDRGAVLGREIYTFTGGAHGMQTKTYYVIDRTDLKTLTLADFFREPGGAELSRIIKEELRRYSGLKNDQPLSEGVFFEDEPETSANFFVTREGLGLCWAPYEIAPYSEGGIEIILPWKKIRPLLKHEAIELLAEFGIYLFIS
jgi:hypothetical protein